VANSIQNRKAEDVVIARILRAHGRRGDLACLVVTDFPEQLAQLECAVIRLPDGSRLQLKVESCRFHKGQAVMKFEGYDTRSAAERLVGGRLVISESDQKQLKEGEFFEYQIIGSEVITAKGQSIGRVASLLRTGGTDLLVVTGCGREYLIPFADEICPQVDVADKRITINPPEGLLEL
jgi:16S rRNA processing protein RimM